MADDIRAEARKAKEERRKALLAQLAGKKSSSGGGGDDQLVGGDGGPGQKKRSLIIRRRQVEEESDDADDTWGSSDEEGDDDMVAGGGAQAPRRVSNDKKGKEETQGGAVLRPKEKEDQEGQQQQQQQPHGSDKRQKEERKSESEGDKTNVEAPAALPAAPARASGELRISKGKVESGKVVETSTSPVCVVVAAEPPATSGGHEEDEALKKKKKKKEKKEKKAKKLLHDKHYSSESAPVRTRDHHSDGDNEEEEEDKTHIKKRKKKKEGKSKSSIVGSVANTIITHPSPPASKSQASFTTMSPPLASRAPRPSSAYAALPPIVLSSPPASRPSSGYASSPLAFSPPVPLVLSAAELAESTMLPPLTDRCALAVLRFLSPGELCKAALVSRAWHRVASEDSLWAGFLTHKIRARHDPSHSGGWKPYFKLAWRRSKIATEILTTERSYVGSLRRVVELFIVPLRDKGNEQVITSEERKALFSEIEVILGLNNSLLSELEERMAQWSFDQCLGDIFKQFTSFLKVYTSYINNFDNSLTTLAKLKQSNENFSAYLSYAESRKECHGLQINSFLVMPVQRIPRYVLLLKDFLKHTPEDHDDHANVSKSLNDMQQVAMYIEKKKEEAENIYHIMAIQDSLVGKFNTIVVPGRKYKFEGALTEAILGSKRTKKKTESYYCFLFNDLFVVAKRKGIISHIKKITAKRLRPGSKGSTWNNTALYSPPFGSSESTEGAKFDFVKQTPISSATTTIDRVSAEEAAEFGLEAELCFKITSADEEAEEEEPSIFAASSEKELRRWLEAFEGCMSNMTPRSAEAYIRIERSRSASSDDAIAAAKKKRLSASYGSAKKPSFLKRMSVGPATSLSHAVLAPSSPPTERAETEEASDSSSPATTKKKDKKTTKDKKLQTSA